MRPSRLWPVLALLLLSACGNEVGPPHPDPLPDVARMRATPLLVDPLHGPMVGPVTVVGLPGAVAGAGAVTIETLDRLFTGRSTDQGTFVISVDSQANAMLSIRYESSPVAQKQVLGAGIMAPLPPGPIPGVPPVTSLGGGRVRVQGRTPVGADAGLIGYNRRTGEVVTARSTAGGDFLLELTAAAGDGLLIYNDQDPLLAAWTLAVP